MLRKLKIKTLLIAVSISFSLLLVLIGIIMLAIMRDSNEDFDHLYHSGVLRSDYLRETIWLNARNHNEFTLALLEGANQPEKIATHVQIIEANRERVSMLIKKFLEGQADQEETKLAQSYMMAREKMIQDAFVPGLEALKSGRLEQARDIILNKLPPLYNDVITRGNAFITYVSRHAEETQKIKMARYDQAQKMVFGFIFIGTLISFWMAFLLSKHIVHPVRKALQYLDQIVTHENYHQDIQIRYDNEVGSILRALSTMQTQLANNVERYKQKADEAYLLQIAIENASTSFMIGDATNHIRYMNHSAIHLFKTNEKMIQKALPHFSADNLINQNIDDFHKNPAHQRAILSSLKEPRRSRIQVGDLYMRFTATPVFSEDGKHLGTVVEWFDETSTIRIQNEINHIVKSASQGDLSERVRLDDKDGAVRVTGERINHLMEMTSSVLEEILHLLEGLQAGDLTCRIEKDYSGIFGKIKESANLTIDRLNGLIGEIMTAAGSIDVASREIAAGNSDLSRRTEAQAASLEETASSMEELSSTVRQNADNARQANNVSVDASDIATRGGKEVRHVVNRMTEINDSSLKISEIISVIDGIAFQTNILALNAAVEAARAGEQGKGFAVVASEVRALAQRSAKAAKEITDLINTSVSKVNSGMIQVEEAGQTMDEIVQAIQQVAEFVSEIAEASNEQSSGIEQVNLAVSQLDDVTQQNAALVEEAAAAAESMQEQAHLLLQAVSVFRIQSKYITK